MCSRSRSCLLISPVFLIRWVDAQSQRVNPHGKSLMIFDTVIRNARVATASDLFASDIGILGRRIVALGESIGDCRHEMDARNR